MIILYNNISLFQTRGPYNRDHRHKGTKMVAQLAHDHGEEQNILSSPQLHCHSQRAQKNV